MELNGIWPVLRRWVVVIALATAAAAAVGWWTSSRGEEGYESTAEVLVGPLNTDSDTMRASSALAQTYAELATSESLLARVSETTGVPVAELDAGVRATANGTTRFLTVRARADEAATAQAVAAAVTEDLVAQSREGVLRPEGQLTVIDPPSEPSAPVAPRRDLAVPLAAMAGLLGAAALVLLYEMVSDTAETAARVEEATGAPTLAVGRRRRFVPARRARHPDALRVAATRVDLAHPGARCVVVTSATDDDGTPGVALALAAVWGEGRPVTVLDATGPELRLWDGPVLDGAPPSAAATDAGAQALVDQLAPRGGRLVVVAGSAVASTAALVWAHVAEVTVLGVRRFVAPQGAVRDATTNLRAAGAELALVVLHDGRVAPPAPGPSPVGGADDGPRPGPDASADADAEGVADADGPAVEAAPASRAGTRASRAKNLRGPRPTTRARSRTPAAAPGATDDADMVEVAGR